MRLQRRGLFPRPLSDGSGFDDENLLPSRHSCLDSSCVLGFASDWRGSCSCSCSWAAVCALRVCALASACTRVRALDGRLRLARSTDYPPSCQPTQNTQPFLDSRQCGPPLRIATPWRPLRETEAPPPSVPCGLQPVLPHRVLLPRRGRGWDRAAPNPHLPPPRAPREWLRPSNGLCPLRLAGWDCGSRCAPGGTACARRTLPPRTRPPRGRLLALPAVLQHPSKLRASSGGLRAGRAETQQRRPGAAPCHWCHQHHRTPSRARAAGEEASSATSCSSKSQFWGSILGRHGRWVSRSCGERVSLQGCMRC